LFYSKIYYHNSADEIIKSLIRLFAFYIILASQWGTDPWPMWPFIYIYILSHLIHNPLTYCQLFWAHSRLATCSRLLALDWVRVDPATLSYESDILPLDQLLSPTWNSAALDNVVNVCDELSSNWFDVELDVLVYLAVDDADAQRGQKNEERTASFRPHGVVTFYRSSVLGHKNSLYYLHASGRGCIVITRVCMCVCVSVRLSSQAFVEVHQTR